MSSRAVRSAVVLLGTVLALTMALVHGMPMAMNHAAQVAEAVAAAPAPAQHRPGHPGATTTSASPAHQAGALAAGLPSPNLAQAHQPAAAGARLWAALLLALALGAALWRQRHLVVPPALLPGESGRRGPPTWRPFQLDPVRQAILRT